MTDQEHTHGNGNRFDPARAYGSAPLGDQQQSTQEKTHQAVHKAQKKGEQVTDQAQQQGQQLADQAQKKADEEKNRAADSMSRAADTMRQKSQEMPGGQRTQQMAGMAANKMDQAADFLHQSNSGDMMKKIEDWTRAHPTGALVIVGVLGIYLGRKIFS